MAEIGLFDSLGNQRSGKFLNILIDGNESESLSFRSIFPPDIFEEIYIISYVSSYKFFFENTSFCR